ncbi:MAG: nitrate reductase subunit beta, partial [Bacteroidales bacterium]|nr:nitrate reductase subunit beta [Bacteroidales bacterium]
IGIMLYDADKIKEAASTANETDLYEEHLGLFLDPHDPKVIAEALKQGIPQSVLDAAAVSPIYKMAIEWKVAFPLHPEYRTLPMVWYVPPLSPIQAAVESQTMGMNGILPDVDDMRISHKYLANLFTAGDEKPVKEALKRMLAMRAYMRSKTVDKEINTKVLEGTGLTPEQTEKMYHLMAIANYEDRFVIPTSHREEAKNAYKLQSEGGYPDGEDPDSEKFRNLFGGF